MTTDFLPDERVMDAPALPTSRPSTRAERWAREHALYFDRKSHKTMPVCNKDCDHDEPGKLESWCKELWLYDYLYWWYSKNWRKQPDWKEGDKVIPLAVPKSFGPYEDKQTNLKIIYRHLEIAKREAA